MAFWKVTGTISVRRVSKLTGPLCAVEEHLFGVFALMLNNTLTALANRYARHIDSYELEMMAKAEQ